MSHQDFMLDLLLFPFMFITVSCEWQFYDQLNNIRYDIIFITKHLILSKGKRKKRCMLVFN